jgi:hypothetical protein
MTDQSIIEDAKAAGAIEIDYTGGYESDWTFTTEELAKFIELQASRQSSQSEPVASIVQEIFDLCIQYERSCHNTGYLHLAEKLLVLAGRANSAIKIMEQPLAAPQQAIPSDWQVFLSQNQADYLKVKLASTIKSWTHELVSKDKFIELQNDYIQSFVLSASPTAPIERDK